MVSLSATRTVEGSTSRFFGASPSLRKASIKKEEFELWSDEASQEAVAALADTPVHSPSPKKRKRLSVFSDASPAVPKAQPDTASQDLTQDTVSSFASSLTRESHDIDTPATSFGSVGDSPNIFSKGITTRFDGLKSKWAYDPDVSNVKSQKPAPFRFGTATKASPTEKRQKPLDHTTADLEDFVPASSPVAQGGSESDAADQVLSDEDWLDLERQPVHPSVGVKIEVKGSEDMLVPDSPRSNSHEADGSSGLNLGRFAYDG